MEIMRINGCAVVFLRASELPDGVSAGSPHFLEAVRRAVKAAFLPPPARVTAEVFAFGRGAALLLRPAREGSCVIALRFRELADASAVIARICREFSPVFTPHPDGSVTLSTRLPRAEAERLAARAWDFCEVSYPSEARAAFLREWRSERGAFAVNSEE